MKQNHYFLEGLNRITIDPLQANPQPCIRGTTITVWDVVTPLIRHAPTTEPSEIYPDLEPQDIQQALIFAVRDLTEAIAIWRNDGLGPIAAIEGFSQLMLEDGFGHPELTDERIQEFAEVIFVSSHRAMAAWWHLGNWMQLFYEQRHRIWQPFSVASIIDSVRREVLQYEPKATVEVVLSDGLPPIRGDYDLSVAIVSIMTDRASHYLDLHTVLSAKSEDLQAITVQMKRKFKYPQSIQAEMEHVFDWNCSPLSIAARIIREHGSELQLHPTEEGVTFEFQLPIWKEQS